MKDSQPGTGDKAHSLKYIKADNERFSTRQGREELQS